MTHQQQEEKNKFQLERIALFSDAVFAISITLLAIELKVPVIEARGAEFNEEFSQAMLHMMPEFVGFLISFVVIGQYWKAHHIIFGYLKDYDRKLISLNTWFLFSIVIMPFTTALESKYMQFLPYLFYAINVMLTGLLQILLWRHIVKKKELQGESLSAGIIRYKYASAWVVVVCFLFSIPVSLIWGGIFGRMFLITILFASMVTRRYYVKKYKISDKI